MATVQFEKISPYKTQEPIPPESDQTYQEYLANLKLDGTGAHERYGFALFGVGRAGTIHLAYLLRNPKVKLLYIVDDDEFKLKKLKKYWNLTDVRFITNAESSVVYEDPKVRAVVVSSPTVTHQPIVEKALEHGIAVFCEKPVAQTRELVRACYEKAKQVNQPLLSGFNRRFDPAYSSVKNRTRNGEVGKVLTIKVCSRDSPLPTIDYLKISGGIFHDCAVHDIDMILFVLGEYPTKVSVMAKANIPEIAAIDDHDTVAILLSFDSGALGIIDLSRHSTYGYDQRLEVFGQAGMLKVENKHQLHNVSYFGPKSVETPPIDYSFASRFQKGYENEMDHFINVLEGKEKLIVEQQDVLAVSKIASACEESVKTGRVIELKWSEQELPAH